MADTITRNARIETLKSRDRSTDIYPRTTVSALVDDTGKKVNVIYTDENGKVPSDLLPEMEIPDVSAQIEEHNNDTDSHSDIREELDDLSDAVLVKQSTDEENPEFEIVAGSISASEKGVAGGIATLGTDGKVPLEQIPVIPDIANQVSAHNASAESHNDIRILISELTNRLNTIANSDDTSLDQLAELVDYIKANRELIEQVTTGKVSVTDIIDNLTTNVSDQPLSAAQGVAIKALIDDLINVYATKNHEHNVSNIIFNDGKSLQEKLDDGELQGEKGDPGISTTHSWEGTVLTVTSGSGTSSADLKGEKGDPATHSWEGTVLTVTSGSGTSSADLKGEKGDTPIKGTDYMTEEDKNELANMVMAMLPNATKGVY